MVGWPVQGLVSGDVGLPCSPVTTLDSQHESILVIVQQSPVTFNGRSGEVAQQRLSVIDEINEETDLFE